MSAATKGTKRVAKGFAVDETMMNDFRSYLGAQKIKIDDDAFKKDLEFIKAEIHYEIDVALFGVSEAQKNLIGRDPQAQYAFTQFADAVKLNELAKNHAGAKGGH
jgi:carboxyl-terminal processing protease